MKPSAANQFQVGYTELFRQSDHTLTGRHLLDSSLSPLASAEALFTAPFVVLSHDTAPDPILTYGYQLALDFFTLSRVWQQLQGCLLRQGARHLPLMQCLAHARDRRPPG